MTNAFPINPEGCDEYKCLNGFGFEGIPFVTAYVSILMGLLRSRFGS